MRSLGGLLVGVVVAASAARAANLVPNPGFESCTGAPMSWTPVGPESVVCDSTTPASGSYDLGLVGTAPAAQAQSTCVVVTPGTFIDDLSFAYRTSSVAVYQVALTVDFYTASDCTGANGSVSTGAGLQYTQTLTRDGGWHALTPQTASIDQATNSVRFVVAFQAQMIQQAMTVDFDDVSFTANGVTTTTASTTTSTTSGQGSTTSTTQPTFTGTGNPASDCFVTVSGLAVTSDGHAVCMDGNPACDADGTANGECTFAFTVCVAEVRPDCQVSSITSVTAVPASLHVALPAVPASEPTCGQSTQVVVPLARHGHRVGRRTLTLTAVNAGKPRQDRDHIHFVCRPH